MLGVRGSELQEFWALSLAIFRAWRLIPRGSIYTTIMELGPKRPFILWFLGPNSIIVVYIVPLEIGFEECLRSSESRVETRLQPARSPGRAIVSAIVTDMHADG